MSEEKSDIGRVADAAKEVAKATGKAIPSIEKLGNFLYRVIGEPVELLSGTFITDPLKFELATINGAPFHYLPLHRTLLA